MKDNEIYEIKDMYDVKLLLSRYLDILGFIQCALDSESVNKEQLKTALKLLEEYTVVNIHVIK